MSNPSHRPAAAADNEDARIAHYGGAHPDSFAGHWFDHDGGVHVAAFTTDLDTHRSNLAARLIEPERLRVVGARYSYRQLEAVMAQIAPHMGEWSITICGPDPRRNAIRVGVSAERVEFIRARLEHAYGDLVWVIEHGPFGWV